jgi:hypothetical protein
MNQTHVAGLAHGPLPADIAAQVSALLADSPERH